MAAWFPACPVSSIFKGGRPANTNYDTALARFERAGAKCREGIAGLGEVEVAVAVARDPAARGEAAAAQHEVRMEPGLRVIPIRVGPESGIGRERARGPLPHPSHHLPQAARAGLRVGNARRGTAMPEIERAGGLRRSVAPRKA